VAAVPSIEQLTAEIASGSPLERLSEASELAANLRARGDELLDHFVDAARAGGSSWNEIGCSLGTSKQAAQQRFAALADPLPGEAPFGLVGSAAEVLTVAAERARSIAKSLGHRCPRTEHVLLAATSPKLVSPAGALLTDCGATPERVRDQLTRMLLSEAPELADRLRNRSMISRVRMRRI
jgi:hypothetical protein